MSFLALQAIQIVDSELDCPPVSLKLLHLGELHHSRPYITQTLGSEVRAGDVLHEGTEVDARVLLSEAISCYMNLYVSDDVLW
jgi:hypothetical protein